MWRSIACLLLFGLALSSCELATTANTRSGVATGVDLTVEFARPGASPDASRALGWLDAIPGMRSCELRAHRYALRIHVLEVGPVLSDVVRGELIRCSGTAEVASAANERRIEQIPGYTRVSGTVEASEHQIGSFTASNAYLPPQLVGTAAMPYSRQMLGAALAFSRSLRGIGVCASAVIRPGRDSSTGISSAGTGAEMAISPPVTLVALYCTAASPAARDDAISKLRARFPGFAPFIRL